MGLWDTITGWVKHDAEKYIYIPIGADRVGDVQYDSASLLAGRDYFRLWLTEMYLVRDRDWFTSWHPAVHSLVRFQFGSRETEIPHIAGELTLKDIDTEHLERVVSLNYPMTALMPFNGGVVEVAAGLLAMPGDAAVKRFIKVMGDLSDVLAVPQLSTALTVLGPIAGGIQELLMVTKGGLHLGLHQAFTGEGGGGANELRAGYFAVIRGTEAEITPPRLWVRADRLHIGDDLAGSKPFTGYPYMLFRVEKRTERDDWEGLTAILDPFNTAIDAMGTDEPERAETFLRTAVAAALRSPDLTQADRRRVALAVKQRFDDAKELGLGAVEVEAPLADAVAKTMSADQALALGEPSLEELFSRGS